MKKILSMLGVIGLTATSTTTIISCEKPNNSENGRGNKPESEPEKPQQPPENSNWKLIENKNILKNTGWYIIIYKWFGQFNIIKINSLEEFGNDIKKIIGNSLNDYKNISVYKWKLNNEPIDLPTINYNTGKITDWKG